MSVECQVADGSAGGRERAERGAGVAGHADRDGGAAGRRVDVNEAAHCWDLDRRALNATEARLDAELPGPKNTIFGC